MATSGSTNFSITQLEIIKDALINLNVIREDEGVAPQDYNYAVRVLNRMVKGWQAQGNHLWLKQAATIFLQKGQTEYILNSTTTDHAATDYEKTFLDADFAAGANQITFDPAVTSSNGDYIGIELDDGSLFWTLISVFFPSGKKADIPTVLPSAASSGNVVYTYPPSNKLDQPFNVYSAIRKSGDEIDTPMFQMSYEEYHQQPNKESLSTPVNYRYDRQRDSAKIAVWPTPADVEYRMVITMARRIQDLNVVSNNPDLPQEWYDAIVVNLAAKMAHAYGKTGTQAYQDLKGDAAELLQTALMFDNEPGSIYLQPDWYS